MRQLVLVLVLFLCPSFLSFLLVIYLLLEITGGLVTAEAVTLPPLTLQPQQPNFNTFDLTSALPPAYTTLLQAIELPPDCAQYVGPTSKCTTQMMALSVYFEDCGDPFTVCRCTDATMTMDTVIDRLGRVPVGLRRYLDVLMVFNATMPSAYTITNGDVQLFGDCEIDTWVHEMMHAFDFANGTAQSSGPGWAAALAADTCVPDIYSLTNEVEDFAQVGVLKTYMLLYDGNPPPGFSADCMAHQLAFMAALPLYDPGTLFGNDCDIAGSGPPARQTAPPAMLDPSRTFRAVSYYGSASSAITTPSPSVRAKNNWAPPGRLCLQPMSLFWVTVMTVGWMVLS